MMKVAAKPIPIEMRPPSAVRVNTSRPNVSVPNGWSRLGFWLASAKFTSYGSYGERNGQTMQKATSPTKTAPATRAALFRG